MKKLLSTILAMVISVSVLCTTVYAYADHVNAGDTMRFNGATSTDAFGALLDWSGIVFGDVNNIIDVEGTLAVGGNFNSTRGFSANAGAYGANPASTDDVALLINGNANISGYGSVWGQTVIGNADGNTYHLSNVTTSETTNGVYTVANTTEYFADAISTAYAVKSTIEALPVNGVCEAAYGTYTFVGDPDADVLVYNVDDSNFASYLFDFTIADGQTVVVNLTTPNKIEFKYGGCRINGNMDPDYLRSFNRNIIINVANSTEMEMTSSELHGILLAPNTDLRGGGSNVCGTSILNSLTGNNGFELHVGYNNSFVPGISTSVNIPEPTAEPTAIPTTEPTGDPGEGLPSTVTMRIDVPRKMAVAFTDGTVYYGGEMKEVVVGEEYLFQMCSVNWDNGIFDDDNGIRGTVVYRMIPVHNNTFLELTEEARKDTDRYIVKGIDIIDNVDKIIYVDCDAENTHLETDVNSFFMAYRFSFEGENYDKKTGIKGVVNTPVESLSVNLPLGTTVACDGYIGGTKVYSDNIYITNNSGEGIYESEYLTSVNDYTWTH